MPVLLEDSAGHVAVYGIPYLEPDAVRAELGCDERSHQAVLDASMLRIADDLRGRPGTRSVVLAHAFVTGADPCESERDISVGGVSAVSASVFGAVDYAALGHLHGPQAVAPSVRYSGSPVAYSFSEERHRKSVTVVQLPETVGGSLRTELVETPVHRPLARISGRLDDLLSADMWEPFTGHYLQVTVTDAVRPQQAMDRLRRRFPHVLVLGFAPDGGEQPESGESYAARLRGRSDLEVATDFVSHVRGPAEPAEVALLAEAFEGVRLAAGSR